jgi:hypothetical protein
MDNLLQKMKQRASNPETIHDMAMGLSPAPKINPVVPVEKIREIEKELGFQFPDLLFKVYSEIGNGGFGPGYGLYRIEDAKKNYLEWMSDPENEWEKGTFPLCTWGCAIDSYVDCEDKAFPVYFTSEDDDHVVDNEMTFNLTDADGNVIKEGKASNFNEVMNNIDTGDPGRGHAAPKPEEELDEDDDEDEDEDVGLLYHKDTIEEWFTNWVEGVNLWSDMMGEDEDEDEEEDE